MSKSEKISAYIAVGTSSYGWLFISHYAFGWSWQTAVLLYMLQGISGHLYLLRKGL